MQSSNVLSGLTRRLVSEDLLSESDASEASSSAAKNGIPVVKYLVDNGIVDSIKLANLASLEFGVPLFDLDSIDYELLPKGVVEEKLITKHHALPLYKRGKRLFVAVSDPTNLIALDEFQFHSKLTVEAVLAEDQKLSKLIDKVLEEQESQSLAEFDDADLDNLDVESSDSEPAEERELFGSPSDWSDASGDTLPPMSLPLSLESCSDDDVLLRRPMPTMPSSLMAPPPPPPPVQLVVSSSAPVLNITFNNCASASVTVHNHDG